MKTVLNYSKVFLLLIASYFIFGVLSCMLPDNAIKENISKSASELASEGDYPQAIVKMTQCQMDNFTDALIMNQIYTVDRSRPVRSSIRMARSYDEGERQTRHLLHAVNGEIKGEKAYSRYWHGNSFLFRPCFMVMDFPMLRWWLFVISSLLFVAMLCIYYREAGLLKTMALVSGFVATCGFVTQFSMQFFPVLALTIIACLWVIRNDRSKDFGILFFIVGSLTCYFDLLTTPLLTLGIPLAVLVSLKNDDDFCLKDNFLEICKLSILWGLGFALSFLAKWGLATLVMGENIFADAYDQSVYRLGVDEFTRWDAVTENFRMLNLTMIIIPAVALVILQLVRHGRFNYKKAVMFLLIGLIPYVWYFILSNHSYKHWWFTYRLQAISVICLFFILSDGFFKGKSLPLHGFCRTRQS